MNALISSSTATTLVATASALVMFAAAAAASADSTRTAPLDAAYVTECGSCHVAYPPRLLPAQSWRTLMSNLDKHFGSDASMDAKAHAAILGYLRGGAGTKAPPPGGDLPRITATEWFKREHREVPTSAWSNPSVKTPANCAACHTRAETGSYREREIRIPK